MLNPSDDSYGIDRVFVRIVDALRAGGLEVRCVLERGNPGNGWLVEVLTNRAFPVAKLPLNNLMRRDVSALSRIVKWQLRLLWLLPRMVKAARQSDIVYVNGFTLVAAALAGRLAKRPVIWHLHEIPPARAVVGCLVRLLSTRQICVSSAVAHAFGLSGRPTCSVVHNAVELPEHTANQTAASEEHPLEIGIVARINQAKGHLVLADAFSDLVRAGLPVRLHIVGAAHASDPTVASQLEALLRGLPANRVIKRGELPDGASYMSNLHVLVAPSVRPDPFPLAVLEGMAAGLVVVASDTGGHSEAITDDVTGLLCRPSDAEDLASRLRELVGDLDRRKRIAAAARLQVVRQFSPAAFEVALTRIVIGQ